jgi:hypothetical protein
MRDSRHRQSVPQSVEKVAADHHRFVGRRIEDAAQSRPLIETTPGDDAIEKVGCGGSVKMKNASRTPLRNDA